MCLTSLLYLICCAYKDTDTDMYDDWDYDSSEEDSDIYSDDDWDILLDNPS